MTMNYSRKKSVCEMKTEETCSGFRFPYALYLIAIKNIWCDLNILSFDVEQNKLIL